jgi:DNA-binding transcriptional LysR family regulator
VSGIHLADGDIRLLRVLDALLQTNSVADAAALLQVTPSAVSHSLRALRQRFGDPLLVRDGARMRPTPRALAVRPALRASLAELGRVLERELVFEPSSSSRTFSLATADYPLFLSLPDLIGSLRHDAPGMSFRLRSLGPGLAESLATGAVDLVLAHAEEEATLALDRALMRTRIFSERMFCVMRADHPAARADAVDWPSFLSAAHIVVNTTGGEGDAIDAVLANLGEARRVALTVTSFAAAVWFAARSDMIATLPEGAARRGQERLGLVVRTPPFEAPRSLAYLWWHGRFHQDPGHIWWRSRLLKAFAPYRDEAGQGPR